MKISFLGGTGTVTGSKFLVSEGDEQILVDCGLFQGLKQLRLLNWETLPLDTRRIKAVLLTHAHLDHCGFLPLLVKQGFNGPIYCTQPTLEITRVILEDAAKIQTEEAEYANKKRFSKHHPARPLYDISDVQKVLPLLRAVNFNQSFTASGFTVQYRTSGHILGAASIHLSNGEKKLLFSGDLGRYHDPLMPVPEAPQDADFIIMESTYGDRNHEGPSSSDQLEKLINDCWRRKSILLIPAFALGRAQNLLYEILQLKENSRIPSEVPVYLNTPMGQEICDIYCKYPSFLKIDSAGFAKALATVNFVKSADESRRLNEKAGPSVIIAASGMLTGGRVLHHLKAIAGNSNNTILLAGFQALGTRGWSLASGKKQVKIHGSYVHVAAKVLQSDSFSAHADQRELLRWLSQTTKKPQTVFLVHGEPSASDELRKAIEEHLGLKAVIPLLNSTHDLQSELESML